MSNYFPSNYNELRSHDTKVFDRGFKFGFLLATFIAIIIVFILILLL